MRDPDRALQTARHHPAHHGRDVGQLDLQARIHVRFGHTGDSTRETMNVEAHEQGEVVETSIGRILFNAVLPDKIGFNNKVMDRKARTSYPGLIP